MELLGGIVARDPVKASLKLKERLSGNGAKYGTRKRLTGMKEVHRLQEFEKYLG